MVNYYKQIIEKLDNLVKSRFIEMFGHNQYEEKPLVELFKTSSGGTPLKGKREYYNGGDIPWLTSGEVNSEHITKAKSMITETALQETSAKIPPLYSVLVSMYGSIGYAGILEFKAAINQAICAIHPSPDYTPEWLCHYIRSKKDELVNQGVGAALTNISQEKIRKLMVPLIPLPQQEAFTAFVHQVDKSKVIAQKAAEKYDQIIKSRFIEMFGNCPKDELFNNCVINMLKGPFGSDIKKDLFVPKSDDTYKVYIQVNAIKSDQTLGDYYISKEYYNQKMFRFKVDPQDYIITCDGTMGKWIRLDNNIEPGIISASLLKIRIDEKKLNPTFFEALWDYDMLHELLSKVRNGCLQHLPSAKVIGQMKIKLPPRDKQDEFALFSKQVDKSKFTDTGGAP